MTPMEFRDCRLSIDCGLSRVTQEILAELLHVAPNTVARWERGERRIPHWAQEYVKRLARNASAAFAELRDEEPAPVLDKRRIRQLLQLCHPDKHNDSRAAHDVTAWLLDLRKTVVG